MSLTQNPTQPLDSRAGVAAIAVRPVVVDLYRDIHKGIRTELFATTEEAGRIDPTERLDRQALRDHVVGVVELLVTHAHHEDGHIQPVVERHLPDLADQVAEDHEVLEVRLTGLREQAEAAVAASDDQRSHLHRLHLDLAAFTSAYLAHQDLEERVIMPALEDEIGVDATLDLHRAIVGSIPPAEMATSLAVMVPAMNVDDRTELLGGMKAGAPPEVFAGMWSLVGSVLEPRDVEALASRLGV